MTSKFNLPKYFDVLEAERGYLEGKNVTELLRAQKKLDSNTIEIIEIAYDLQAGTYIDLVGKNREFFSSYCREAAGIIGKYVSALDTILDVGTGELTTLSMIIKSLTTKPLGILAFDLSWSRIFKGLQFAKDNMGEGIDRLTSFVANMGEIPLPDKSVNVTISSHALEPNGGILPELLIELFRVTSDKLVLFEPCYEINSEEGKERMNRLGYIRGLDAAASALGGTIVDKIIMRNIVNPLNPTVCFIIEPPYAKPRSTKRRPCLFSVPGTSYPLDRIDDFFFSDTTRLCFPMLKAIPILKSSAAILASALNGDADRR